MCLCVHVCVWHVYGVYAACVWYTVCCVWYMWCGVCVCVWYVCGMCPLLTLFLNQAWAVLRAPPFHSGIFLSFFCLFCMKILIEPFFRVSPGWHGASVFLFLLHSVSISVFFFQTPLAGLLRRRLLDFCLSVASPPPLLTVFLLFSLFVLLSFFVSVSVFVFSFRTFFVSLSQPLTFSLTLCVTRIH